MLNTIPYKLKLVQRNEGKLKSYESCADLRAWSHDVETKSRHLKTWIQIDMPLCIVPVSTLTVFLKEMGCKYRGKFPPKCRPNCKSKVILQSVCTSCQSIRQCFQNDPTYRKYFEEPEYLLRKRCRRRHLLRRRYSIKTWFRPLMKVRQLLRSPKDQEPLSSPGVYEIPCECGKAYVGETGRNVSTRLKEHIRSVKNMDTNSAVAEHVNESGAAHFLRFDRLLEELDTSHWPCERCLEALKSIKMFWRIIREKLFHINIPTTEKLPLDNHSSNIHSTVKSWQTTIIHETGFVKNLMPFLGDTKNVKTSYCQYDKKDSILVSSHNNSKEMTDESTCTSNSAQKFEKSKPLGRNKTNQKPKKVSRSVSVKVKKSDVGCDTRSLKSGEDELKAEFNNLQLRFDAQKDDVERLRKENIFLKIEVQKAYNGLSIDPHKCSMKRPAPDALAVLPQPYDDELIDNVDDVDSEMIITMKNCKKSDQKQVSVLQVLHKSNQPFYSDNSTSDALCRKEDPIRVLAKIQTTLGTMVQREINRVTETRRGLSGNPPAHFDASYHNVKGGKSK